MNVSKLSETLPESLLRATDYIKGAKGEPPPHPVLPCLITISREAGSHAIMIARAVGKLLGWAVYDQELLDCIGKEMGIGIDMLKLIDEKPISWLEQCVVNLASDFNLSQDTYMIHLVAAVRSLAARGNCVIVGRGSTFLLPLESTLRLRLVGDRKDRVAFMQTKQNMSANEAVRWVDKTDRERHDFVKRYFDKEVSDPHLYDLVLNTSRLSAVECADLIVEALHRLQGRKHVAATRGTSLGATFA